MKNDGNGNEWKRSEFITDSVWLDLWLGGCGVPPTRTTLVGKLDACIFRVLCSAHESENKLVYESHCSANADCVSGACTRGVCECGEDAHCPYLLPYCDRGTCKPGGLSLGETCFKKEQCNSGKCDTKGRTHICVSSELEYDAQCEHNDQCTSSSCQCTSSSCALKQCNVFYPVIVIPQYPSAGRRLEMMKSGLCQVQISSVLAR